MDNPKLMATAALAAAKQTLENHYRCQVHVPGQPKIKIGKPRRFLWRRTWLVEIATPFGFVGVPELGPGKAIGDILFVYGAGAGGQQTAWHPRRARLEVGGFLPGAPWLSLSVRWSKAEPGQIMGASVTDHCVPTASRKQTIC